MVLKTFLAPRAVIPGSNIEIEDMTVNNGPVPAQASATRFYLSTDAKLDTGDVFLGSSAIPELAARQSSSGSTTVTIPPGTALGRYFLIGVADADNLVAETSNTNKRIRALNVTLPDLTLSALRTGSSAAAGGSIAIQETTRNRGLVASDASTTKFFLSADAILDGADILLGSRAVPALGARAKSQDPRHFHYRAAQRRGSILSIPSEMRMALFRKRTKATTADPGPLPLPRNQVMAEIRS
jgi:subtilase family serine protease